MTDIIVMGRNFDGHISNLKEVFTRLENTHLQLKCVAQKQVNILGNSEVLHISKKWKQFERGHDHEIWSFLGLCSYYSWFVKNFGKIVKPLHCLSEKYTAFNWASNFQQALLEGIEFLEEVSVYCPNIHPRDEGLFILEMKIRSS